MYRISPLRALRLDGTDIASYRRCQEYAGIIDAYPEDAFPGTCNIIRLQLALSDQGGMMKDFRAGRFYDIMIDFLFKQFRETICTFHEKNILGMYKTESKMNISLNLKKIYDEIN